MSDNQRLAKAKEFLGHNAAAAVIGAVASAVVSLPVSYWVAVTTSAPNQDRQMRLEQATKFASGAGDFLNLGLQIVPRLNSQAPLDQTKIAIADESGKQAINAQALIEVFGPSLKTEASDYQTALNQFVRTTNRLKAADQIKEWATAYDGVVTTQNALTKRMYTILKVKPEPGAPTS